MPLTRSSLWNALVKTTALALLLAATAGHAQGIDESELLPVEEAFKIEAKAVSRNWIEFQFKVAPGYYLYRERIKIQPADSGFKFNPLHTPPGEFKEDPNFGRMEVYHNDFTAKLTGAAASGVSALTFNVGYQGCADIGICYPPQRTKLTVSLPAEDADAGIDAAALENMPVLDLGKPASLLGGGDTGSGIDLGGGSASITLGGTDELPLPPEQAFVFEAIAASPTEFLLRFTMPPGYYLYRDRSEFHLADASAGMLGLPRWPEARTVDDPEFGPVPVFFDLVEVPLTLARGSGAAQDIGLVAKFQGCEEGGVCYPPMTRMITVALPAATPEAMQQAAALVERERADAATVNASGSQQVDAAPEPETALWQALLLALLGGLILNLMPCVLPVLSLKAISLAESAERPEEAHRHALWYTAGVLSSFAAIGLLVIGLRSGGQALGWGFQLQQPLMVALMGYVMVVLGLSLSGVITLGASLSNLGSGVASSGGAKGDFFTGVLACVVASPCTAPFMGTALAYAFAQSAFIALLIFLMLGLGLALPFLLVGFIPGLAHRLPKPGAWMETFKQWLAFPLYLTAVWLVWVLGQQRGPDAMALWLFGALAITAALWWWERGRYQDQGRVWRVVVTLLLLVAAALALRDIHRTRPVAAAVNTASAISIPYSAEKLAALRAEGKPVFINMTADWCLSCKVNERTTLSRESFVELLQSTGTVYLKGDWTNEDPAISAFLKQHNAVGVPLYVYFPAGGAPGRKLPAVLTPDLVAEALK
jgi:thiol:disulfide interchange protein